MPTFTLHSHPDTPCPFIEAFGALVNFRQGGGIECIYELQGEMDRLAIPKPGPSVRMDELWRHTCFEIFLRQDGSPGYDEFNFSPSTAWAAYRFETYRSGRVDIGMSSPPAIAYRQDQQKLSLQVSLAEPGHSTPATRLALSAVLEDRDGSIYYWALRHAAGKPDFHHDSAFVAV